MRPIMMTMAFIGVTIVGLDAVRAGMPPSKAPDRERVTLLGTLAAWQYPESKIRGGASMSDGGFPGVQSVKCKAILTTPDPFEKVVKFYADKFGTESGEAQEANVRKVKETDPKSLSIQDDSEGRPVALHVIVVNKADTSTTLVISRAKGEAETHIAWSHYLRLDHQRR